MTKGSNVTLVMTKGSDVTLDIVVQDFAGSTVQNFLNVLRLWL